MKKRRVTAVVMASAATITAGLFTLGSFPATGSSADHSVWKGRPANSVAQAMRLGGAAAANTLTLVDQSVRQQSIDVGTPGGSPGDFVLVDLRLSDETGATVVGRGTVRCETGITTQECTGILRVYRRGQIVVDGAFRNNSPAVALSILGGTGEFKGAGGVVRPFETPAGQALILRFTR